MIEVVCPSCNARFKAHDSAAGRIAACSSCGSRLRIPDSSIPPPLPSAPPQIKVDTGDTAAQWRRTRKGFFALLFDVSFSEFLTPRLTTFIYCLSLVILTLIFGLAFVLAVGSGLQLMNQHAAAGLGIMLLAVIGVPTAYLLNVIFIRVNLELIIVTFRNEQHTRDLAARHRKIS